MMQKNQGTSFLKENLTTFLQVLIIVVGLILSSFYLFNTFLKKQIEVKTKYLADQVEVCGQNIEQNISEFKYDLKHFVSTINSSDYLKDNVDYPSRVKLKNFLDYNKEFVDTLVITNHEKRIKSWLTNEHFLSFKVLEGTALIDTVSFLNKDFIYQQESGIFSFKNGSTGYLLKLNVEGFLNHEFEQFYVGDQAVKQLYSEKEGLVDIQIPNYLNSEEDIVDNGSLALIRESLLSGLKNEYTFNIQKNGVNDKLLTAMYPIDLLGKKYAILFGIPINDIETEFYKSFRFILVISITIILLVVLLFSFNLFRIKKTTDELESNKLKLTALVSQQKLLLEYSDDFTYRFNKENEFDYVSENVQKVLGFTPEEYSNSDYRRYTDNTINETAREISEMVLKKGIEHNAFYCEIYDSYGEAKVLELREKAILNTSGEITGVIGIAKDITQKFNSDLKFRILFEYSADPHMIYDSNGIMDCNEATVKLLGYETKDEIIGKKPVEFSPELQANERSSLLLAEEMDAVVIEKGSNRYEWEFQNKNQKKIPVEVSLTKVKINQKQVILGVWYDLTERKKVEEALISAKQKAEDLASQKQQFLSSMSHEIRTPLNAVIGYTHLLLDENPMKSQIDKLKSLQFSADNLLSLVNDILDHSKIESGKIHFASTSFKIRERLMGIREMFDIKAKRKNLLLKLDIDPLIPEKVIGDPVRLNQILLNLVGNAIKFTNRGEIAIKASLIDKIRDVVTIKFDVTDTGIGISKEKQNMIFDTFVQADAKILNEYGGTGLGLSISKNLVEFQGGKISVTSKIGVGSTFSFVLTFKQNRKEKRSESDKSQDELKPLDQANVLLVEDNLINQKIANQFLSKWGANVVIAPDGKRGFEEIQRTKFDFILMDLQMPIMDGYESTKAIRSLKGDYYKKVPIITLTADAFVEVKERTIEAGMNDYVTKPINPVEFLKVLKKYYKHD